MLPESSDSVSLKKESCHDGHRQRMREKYIRNGADIMESHELVEMLLYYCVQRRNTNEIAHAMLNRFGTIENLLSADIEELKQFDYISENGAVLIKLVGELCRRSMLETATNVYRYDTLEKVGKFLVGIFRGQTEEKLYLMMFDSGMRMLDLVCVCEGSVGSVNMCARKIIENVVSAKATNIIIAHNHPNGIAVPSKNDLSLTHQIETLVELIDTKLLCHLIVAGDRYAPVKNVYGEKFDLTI